MLICRFSCRHHCRQLYYFQAIRPALLPLNVWQMSFVSLQNAQLLAPLDQQLNKDRKQVRQVGGSSMDCVSPPAQKLFVYTFLAVWSAAQSRDILPQTLPQFTFYNCIVFLMINHAFVIMSYDFIYLFFLFFYLYFL